MNYQQAEHKNKIRFGEDGNSLMTLIIVNVVAFIILMFLKVVYQLSYDRSLWETLYNTNVFEWVVLPADLKTLLYHPWVIVTHFIAQDSIWYLIGDMLFLWAFGYLLQDLTGNRHIIPVFLYGCFIAAILFVATSQFSQVSQSSFYNGAGAGVMAIAIAATFTTPQFRIFPMISGGIPIWILTLIYVVIDLAGVANHGFPFLLAHIGGAGIGFLYISQLRKGSDWSNWMYNSYNSTLDLFNSSKKNKKKTSKQKVPDSNKTQRSSIKNTSVDQQKVDEILDKISQKGYQLLTQEEKNILKKAADSESF